MISVIGEEARIAAASDAALLGLRGTVVLESMNTLTIRAGRRKVVLPKVGSALELSGGEVILGDDLVGRLEERVAVMSRRRSR